jgi:peroxiredoxin
MKFVKIAGVMVVLSILGIGLLAGCAKKNPDDVLVTPPVTPAEDLSETSVTDTSSKPGPPGQKGDTVETVAVPEEDPGADRRAAPDFTLTDLSGNEHSLSDFRGRVVLVDFWATWCGPCRREIPHLVKLYEGYSSQGFVVLGVGLDKKAKLAEFARENRMSYVVLVDEKGVTGSLYAIRGIPRTLIIDKKGRIAFDHTGFAPGMEVKMEQEIRTLLAEEY